MGTPDFAVPTLRALIAHHEVVGVVTQPDRPAGRKNVLTPPPVKGMALEHGIEVFQPEKLRRAEAIAVLRRWPDIDAYVVAAFGQILPQVVLDIPRLASINVHASLLPRWRGAAPIQAAIRAGDAETGITIMKMDAGLDTGPMLRARAIPIAADETGASLHDRLAALGADLLIPTLADFFSGLIVPQPQDDTLATLAPRIAKDEGRIDWTRPAVEIERLVRAFTPWPGTFTDFNGATLKILRGTVAEGSGQPGQVVRADDCLAVATGVGLYVLESVQLAGKNPADAGDFARGYPEFIGAVLGG
jgi:methionyl-tRNA formyltransferase